MKILVANLGSTSYKYTLFEAVENRLGEVARGKVERVTDFGAAIEESLRELSEQRHLKSPEDLDAVGFKAVMGWEVTGCVRVDQNVIEDLRKSITLAPAHNPAYIAGMEQFGVKAPEATRVALFETALYQWVPAAHRLYAVPREWQAAGVKRNGFHGASHKFVSERTAELLGRDDVAERVRRLYHGDLQPVEGPPLRVISCHLGGSSSVTAFRDGVAIGTSMGMTPQSGIPQNNRAGDLDAMVVPHAMKTFGLSVDEVEHKLTKESGLLGLSGVSNDIRDVKAAALEGNVQAAEAIQFFVQQIRHWIGAFWIDLRGLDALVFTGGIGENNPDIREAVCQGLEEMALTIDREANEAAKGVEADLSGPCQTKTLVIPANEELVVATETWRLLS